MIGEGHWLTTLTIRQSHVQLSSAQVCARSQVSRSRHTALTQHSFHAVAIGHIRFMGKMSWIFAKNIYSYKMFYIWKIKCFPSLHGKLFNYFATNGNNDPKLQQTQKLSLSGIGEMAYQALLLVGNCGKLHSDWLTAGILVSQVNSDNLIGDNTCLMLF